MRLLRYWRLGLGSATLVGALGAGGALAQQPVPTFPDCVKKASPQDNELAKSAHKLATSYYDRGDYDKAIQYWNEALKNDCSVNDLLINISNAYEKKGDKAATVATLEAYLKRTGPNPVMEEKVKNLKAAMAPAPTVTAPPVTTVPTVTAPPTATATAIPTAPPVADGPRPFGYTPWYVVGGGGALAIVGAVLVGVGSGKVSDAAAQCPVGADQMHDCGKNGAAAASEGNTGRTMGTAGGALLGVGLAAAAGGLVWQFAFNKPAATPKKGARSGLRDVWVTPVAGGHGPSGVVAGGSF